MIKLVCYQCGTIKEMTKEEYKKIHMDPDGTFMCDNNNCDSWQFFEHERNKEVKVVGKRKLKCPYCNDENFKPCGDGDGLYTCLGLWKCECEKCKVWVYDRFDNEDNMLLKKKRKEDFKL